MKGTVVVAGALAQRPGAGGHAWVFLQYLLGFQRLGWRVLFLDRLDRAMCHDKKGEAASVRDSVELSWLAAVLEWAGLSGDWAVLTADGDPIGLSRTQIAQRLHDASLLINVMGFLSVEDLPPTDALTRVFLDIDPGFGQMWRALDLADPFDAHDAFVTIGENVGLEGCTIPTCGLDWITTPQPVVLEEWPMRDPVGQDFPFTSVAAWRGPYAPVEYDGRTYGLRVHEFRRFVELPRRSGRTFEVALDIDAAEAPDLDALRRNSWVLADPRVVAGTPEDYRNYIARSGAELMVAKNMYVASNSGWFSDRSICYLASGRPVLAQDTGIRGRYPVGDGLLVFAELDEAAAGVEEIASDPARHGRAARDIAEAHFSSEIVLPRLLERLGVG